MSYSSDAGKLPPSACLKGARVLLGLSQAASASALHLKRSIFAAVEAGVADEDVVNAMLQGYRTLGISIRIEGSWWFVTRPIVQGETRYNIEGMATAAARTAAGLTQSVLATSAGVALRTVASFERGSNVNRSTGDALATALARRQVEVVRSGRNWGFKIQTECADREGADEDATAPQSYRTFDVDVDHPSLLHLRIEIVDTQPAIWREILIPENATFEDLHRTIQVAFGWRDQHWHEFDLGLRVGSHELNNSGSISEGHAIDERAAWLYDVSHRVPAFGYLYDFGDNWWHRIEQVSKEIIRDRPRRPQIIGGSMAGPIENSFGPSGYNAMAKAMRKGRLETEKGDWLERLEYGRNYDPDRFSVAEADGLLARLTFDIPATWLEQHERRKLIDSRAMELPPPASIAPPPKAPMAVPQAGLEIVRVEKFGRERYEKEGLGDRGEDGWSLYPSRKNGTGVVTRVISARVLGDFLEYAPDIASFSGLPVRIVYSNGLEEEILVPDYEVIFADRSKALVLICTEQHISQLEILRWIRALLLMEGTILYLLPAGIFEMPEIKTAGLIRQCAPMPILEPDTKAADFLAASTRRGAVKVKDAIRQLIENGFAESDERAGPPPENRVLGHLLEAVAMGAISIDASVEDLKASTIGDPSAFAHTMWFKPIAEATDYEPEIPRPPRRRGRPRKRLS